MPFIRSISKPFRYLFSKIADRESAQLGFTQMGLGIENRLNRYSKQWEIHHEHCNSLQRKFVELADPQRDELGVLGAGRLFDIDIQYVEKRFKKIELFDRDQLCMPVWRREAKRSPERYEFFIVDLSGVLSAWSNKFQTGLVGLNWIDALHFLRSFEVERSSMRDVTSLVSSSSYRLSLNMLSQVPIYWRDKVEQILEFRFGEKVVSEKSDEWLAAFGPSGASLVRSHLTLLIAGLPDRICIIADEQYDTPGATEVDALLGVNLTAELSKTFGNYEVIEDERWIWDIVPEDTKHKEEPLRSYVRGLVLAKI